MMGKPGSLKLCFGVAKDTERDVLHQILAARQPLWRAFEFAGGESAMSRPNDRAPTDRFGDGDGNHSDKNEEYIADNLADLFHARQTRTDVR